ncbi:lysylphosphatidylglycerol synthase transmembrane domain-containing protein [Actinopolymorpha alba]|uniref:lysylphosphatidylglycerol synthase transmembrane domain-containing protein n=1 Tax=Actinopolymorpha alba TaxID=533267 RepID=UPI00039AA329|nr:lysylphosphatidylglycerol synthase transmembrane domain-containing protein [Actinopolymorpha alba]
MTSPFVGVRTRPVMSALSILVAVGLVVGLPYFVGIGWGDIWAQFAELEWPVVVGLFGLWLAGLWAYTYVLTASLPGLTNPQALTLNCVGSAVSNLMPFGGAAGVAVNFALARAWGFRTQAVAVSTVTSGIWNLLARFLLPAFGLLALLASGRVPDAKLAVPAELAALALIGVVAATVLALRWDPAARMLGQAADTGVRLLPSRIRARVHRPSLALENLRGTTADLLRSAWPTMTLGMIAYVGLQAVLFCACLLATGAYIGLAEAIAAFALGRLLTTVVVTPGGFGIAEAGTAAVMIHLSAPAGPVAAAVLLFSMFTYVLEIPLGAIFWSLRTFVGPRGDARNAVPVPSPGGPAGTVLDQSAAWEDHPPPSPRLPADPSRDSAQ